MAVKKKASTTRTTRKKQVVIVPVQQQNGGFLPFLAGPALGAMGLGTLGKIPVIGKLFGGQKRGGALKQSGARRQRGKGADEWKALARMALNQGLDIGSRDLRGLVNRI